MLFCFDALRGIAEPIVIEKAADKLTCIAGNMGLHDDLVDAAKIIADVAYNGIEDFFADKFASLAETLIEDYITEDEGEESTLLSTAAGYFAGLGSFFCLGGGIHGALISTCLTKATETFVRKEQYLQYGKTLEKLDSIVERQAQKDFEEYGYSAPGF